MLVVALASVLALACGAEEPIIRQSDPVATIAPAPTIAAAPTVATAPTFVTAPTIQRADESGASQDVDTVMLPTVSDRGYNSLGESDAPIVLFDFSDFV